MSGREFNKIAAGVLIAGLVVMISGKVVDVLYKPVLEPKQRGFAVDVPQDSTETASAAPAEEKFEINLKELMKEASVEAGKALYVKCAACHTDTKGGPNRVGPNLWNVVGAPKAAHDGYNYSNALKALGGEWSYDDLAHFLHKPAKFAKGTKMSFAGLSKEKDIANMIAYLRSLSDSPKPLP